MALRIPRPGIGNLAKDRDQGRHGFLSQDPQADSSSDPGAAPNLQMRFPGFPGFPEPPRLAGSEPANADGGDSG
jgi:hypothetical protein